MMLIYRYIYIHIYIHIGMYLFPTASDVARLSLLRGFKV